jgi:hypothetical protein
MDAGRVPVNISLLEGPFHSAFSLRECDSVIRKRGDQARRTTVIGQTLLCLQADKVNLDGIVFRKQVPLFRRGFHAEIFGSRRVGR